MIDFRRTQGVTETPCLVVRQWRKVECRFYTHSLFKTQFLVTKPLISNFIKSDRTDCLNLSIISKNQKVLIFKTGFYVHTCTSYNVRTRLLPGFSYWLYNFIRTLKDLPSPTVISYRTPLKILFTLYIKELDPSLWCPQVHKKKDFDIKTKYKEISSVD